MIDLDGEGVTAGYQQMSRVRGPVPPQGPPPPELLANASVTTRAGALARSRSPPPQPPVLPASSGAASAPWPAPAAPSQTLGPRNSRVCPECGEHFAACSAHAESCNHCSALLCDAGCREEHERRCPRRPAPAPVPQTTPTPATAHAQAPDSTDARAVARASGATAWGSHPWGLLRPGAQAAALGVAVPPQPARPIVPRRRSRSRGAAPRTVLRCTRTNRVWGLWRGVPGGERLHRRAEREIAETVSREIWASLPDQIVGPDWHGGPWEGHVPLPSCLAAVPAPAPAPVPAACARRLCHRGQRSTPRAYARARARARRARARARACARVDVGRLACAVVRPRSTHARARAHAQARASARTRAHAQASGALARARSRAHRGARPGPPARAAVLGSWALPLHAQV